MIQFVITQLLLILTSPWILIECRKKRRRTNCSTETARPGAPELLAPLYAKKRPTVMVAPPEDAGVKGVSKKDVKAIEPSKIELKAETKLQAIVAKEKSKKEVVVEEKKPEEKKPEEKDKSSNKEKGPEAAPVPLVAPSAAANNASDVKPLDEVKAPESAKPGAPDAETKPAGSPPAAGDDSAAGPVKEAAPAPDDSSAKPVEAKASDDKAGDAKPVEAKASDVKAGDAKPVEAKASDVKAGDVKPGTAPAPAKPGAAPAPAPGKPGAAPAPAAAKAGAAPAPAPVKPGAAPVPAPAKPGAAAPAAPAKPGAAPAPAAAKPGAAPAKPAAAAPPAGQAKPEAPDTVPEMTQNAADAPDLKPHVTVDPSTEMVFKADQTNQAKVVIKNVHDKKIMFKIKLSDNVYFQVNQAFGTLEPGKTVTVILTHKKSPPKEGKLVVMNTLFTGNEKEIAAQFKTLTKPTGKNVNVKWIAK